MTEQEINTVQDFAEQNNTPGAGSEQIRGKIIEIYANKNLSGPTKNTRISNEVVAELESRGRFFYHADLRDFASAMFFDQKRKLLHRIKSDPFESWLSQFIAVNRATPLFNYVMKEVENAALNGPSTTGIIPEHYWTSRGDRIYISNGDGEIIKITAEGCQPVDNGTDGVLFACGKTLSKWALVPAVDPFESCKLFSDISCTAGHAKNLLKAWVISLPTNPKCKPPLSTIGAVGSGKTRIAKGITELLGLPPWIVKADEQGENDFWPAVNEGGIFVLDNADTDIRWLPDALAAAATQGSSVRRRLYTNDENVHLQARSWIVITSANPSFASDAGLADRLLVVRMNRREGDTSDAELSEEITNNRSAGLSFIAETLSKALRDKAPTPKGLNSRHPDFASFAIRIGRALGQEAQFVTALRTAEADKSQICVENDFIGGVLLALVREYGEQVGPASDFVDKLQIYDSKAFDKLTARKFSNRVSNLWPHLQSVMVAAKEVKHGGQLEYTFAERCE